MRGAAGLAMLTAGAILAFAVSARVPGINLRIAGVIIMIAGVAAMITPAHAAGRVHRASWSRGRPGRVGGEADDLAYLLQDPAVLAAEVLRGAGAGQPAAGGTQQDGRHGRSGTA